MNRAGHILVVDDEEYIRNILKDNFIRFGYEVTQADDGADALRKFVPGKFDCVISDLSMPVIDGMELLKRIRLLDADVVFLIVTGFPAMDSAITAMKEGAYDYLTKPFKLDDIKMRVERAIEARKTEMQLKKVKGLVLTLIILLPVLVSLGIIFGIFWKGI